MIFYPPGTPCKVKRIPELCAVVEQVLITHKPQPDYFISFVRDNRFESGWLYATEVEFGETIPLEVGTVQETT